MLTDFAGSHADYRAWLATITGTHQRRITITVTDLEHNVLTELTPRFVNGEVTVDADVPKGEDEATRALSIEILDPTRSLQFEPDTPGSTPLHYSRMLRVGWSVYVPVLERWVTCPVFTGRVTDFDREGAIAYIAAKGKEVLALGQAGTSTIYPKKTRKIEAVRRMLTAAGETRFDFPDAGAGTGWDTGGATLPDRVTVRSTDSRWPKAKKIVASMDRVLFYDARGVAVIRRRTARPCFTFDAQTLASEVRFDRDTAGIRNRWIVQGGKPKGSKTRVHVDIQLPKDHALSPANLGRNGKPFYLIERIENGNIKTTVEALRVAKRHRDDAMRLSTDYTFDALPMPHLEENDLVGVRSPDGAFVLRMRRWTLPLGLDGAPPMTVGSIKRTTLPAGRLGGHGGSSGNGWGRGPRGPRGGGW